MLTVGGASTTGAIGNTGQMILAATPPPAP
jgi:hypothetical protein